jgi:hypothetical protein
VNGGPACGAHNRDKNRGFRAVRDLEGSVVHYRPDGRAITAAGQPESLPDDPNWRCWRVRSDQLGPLDPSDGWC